MAGRTWGRRLVLTAPVILAAATSASAQQPPREPYRDRHDTDRLEAPEHTDGREEWATEQTHRRRFREAEWRGVEILAALEGRFIAGTDSGGGSEAYRYHGWATRQFEEEGYDDILSGAAALRIEARLHRPVGIQHPGEATLGVGLTWILATYPGERTDHDGTIPPPAICFIPPPLGCPATKAQNGDWLRADDWRHWLLIPSLHVNIAGPTLTPWQFRCGASVGVGIARYEQLTGTFDTTNGSGLGTFQDVEIYRPSVTWAFELVARIGVTYKPLPGMPITLQGFFGFDVTGPPLGGRNPGTPIGHFRGDAMFVGLGGVMLSVGIPAWRPSPVGR